MTRMILLAALALSVFYGFTAEPVRAVDEVIDSVMNADPDIPAAQVEKVFPSRLASLWLQALERPEKDLQCQAAATIALARQRGMAGLETAVAPLLRMLDQPEQPRVVRLAAAQTLITLDARQSASNLFQHGQSDGVEMRSFVEPALARWDFQPMRAVWLERLDRAGLPSRSQLLAMRGLATVRETKAVPRLRELALSPVTDPILRLEAARALGTLRASGGEADALTLMAEHATPGSVAPLAAASLLRKHHGDAAARILLPLAVEAEPATAAVALDALLDDDPRRVLPLMPKIAASRDAAIRARAVETHRQQPRAEHIPLVAGLLDDPHPQVRIAARKALLTVARSAEHRTVVVREATRHLGGTHWRALEQAAIVLATLQHKPAATRLIALLRFERPEVFLTAAWSLRQLAVPETLPAQLSEIERRWQLSEKPPENHPFLMIDLQVSQLAQSLGQARYAPAAGFLRRFVPKQWNIGAESRAAAIWALCLIHQKAPPPDLVDALIGRLSDDSSIVPEDNRVRRMAAVALGRMKAQDGVDALKKYYPGKLTLEPISNACGWALEQITGQPFPRTGIVQQHQTGWFLEGSDPPAQ